MFSIWLFEACIEFLEKWAKQQEFLSKITFSVKKSLIYIVWLTFNILAWHWERKNVFSTRQCGSYFLMLWASFYTKNNVRFPIYGTKGKNFMPSIIY